VNNDVAGDIYQALVVDPKNTFHSVKRFMGKKFKQVAQDALRVPFEVVASDPVGGAINGVVAPGSIPGGDALSLVGLGPKGDGAGLAAMNCPALDRKVMPEEVSMHILRKLLDMAEVGTAKCCPPRHQTHWYPGF